MVATKKTASAGKGASTAKRATKATTKPKTQVVAKTIPAEMELDTKKVDLGANKIKDAKYNGWLVSDNFMKRSAAVWGHFMVFNFIVGLICCLIALILGISLFAVLFNNTSVREFMYDDFGHGNGMRYYNMD